MWRVMLHAWHMPDTGRGLGGGATFIIMEHLNFSGRPSQRELGRKLAEMHLAEPLVSAWDYTSVTPGHVLALRLPMSDDCLCLRGVCSGS